MENREPSAEYAQIGAQLIASDPLLEKVRGSRVRIAYLSSDREKTSKRRAVLADCEKVPERYAWTCPYDFVVTVYEPNAERLTDEQLRILLLHELMHVGIEEDGNDERYYSVPHDVEDFRALLERYGIDWSES